jgi:hypothetical protein
VIISIGKEQKRGREDVVCEHLRIILALLLNVNHEHLLYPETPLDKVVPLEDTFDFSEGPAFPDAMEIEPEL